MHAAVNVDVSDVIVRRFVFVSTPGSSDIKAGAVPNVQDAYGKTQCTVQEHLQGNTLHRRFVAMGFRAGLFVSPQIHECTEVLSFDTCELLVFNSMEISTPWPYAISCQHERERAALIKANTSR